MPRGRKPKPTALKVLEGTRSDRLNPAEPVPVPGLPECPEHLDEVAREEWARIVPQLDALGVLSRTDGSALALYCDAFSQWVQANEEIGGTGLIVYTEKGGVKANPAVAMARAARAQMHRLLVEFGCTPSSRTRVHSTRPEAPKDDLSAFLARKKAR